MFMYFIPLFKNAMIYGENILYFYTLCIILTFIIIVLCWKFDVKQKEKFCKREKQKKCNEEVEHNSSGMESASGLMSSKTQIEKISLNQYQIYMEQEKKVEKEQLKNIFKIIQQDKDKFQIESLQELEEQMKLYRE
ncbi:matrix-remodeling-associated protein 7-like isoform X2 [Cimex lectularius]|uniref:Matrix-remodeling-associated protein 7 helical domain-containing protein n=1 Tax=Cimex lectularius TaxID=79782 RepID=A0A8I6REI7_CIMLE|nr:matrix-remodeling-associated protein 7-like isoform X2 [Cimex lectularius]